MYQDRSQRASATTDFEFLSKLGQGSFGIVYKVRRKLDKNIYVLKQINIAQMNAQLRKEALNEVKILSSLDNPYIVRYYESFLEKNNLNIVMEYCEGGDLAQYIKASSGKYLTEPKIWKFLIQMCLGLAYIHGKKILHRDIKSMNVFLSKQEEVRIGDLGVAKALADTGNFAHTMIGTPYYLSPEMCEEKPYNSKSDMWAFGCILYEMCTKRHPFEATNQAALILKIINGKFAPISPTFSPELTQILNQCLCRDYKKRPSAKSIIANPAFQMKAKELSINLGDYEDPNVFLKDVSSRLPPQKTPAEQVLRKPEEDRLKPKPEKDSVKEKSPVPRVAQKENADNRIITPTANNAFKIKGGLKAPYKEDLRPKSPIENPSAAILKRNLPSNDLVSPKPILNRDKSPVAAAAAKAKEDKISYKDVSANNPERNIKRIRKGAPQALGRQAAIAGNQNKAQPKPSVLRPAAVEPKSKSRSPIGRDISADQRRTSLSDDFEHEEETKEKEEKARVASKANLPDSLEELEPISQEKRQSTEEDKIPSIPKEEEAEEEAIPEPVPVQVNDQNDFANDTQFEPIVSEVQWNVVDQQKPAEQQIKVNNQDNKPKHNELEEIPVFHVTPDVPTFEMNAITPELYSNEDNEDEEHEYWDSNEDENAYNNDKFEEEDDGKEERKENKGYESPEYEEDFESDGDTTDDTNRKTSFEKMTEARKEATRKKLEKAKKEKEDIEKLIKDRSAVFLKHLGEEQWKEMISFLRKKMEFVQNEKDLKEIDEFLKKKIGSKLPAEQINFIMIKILPFEMKKGRLEEEIREYNFELQ